MIYDCEVTPLPVLHTPHDTPTCPLAHSRRGVALVGAIAVVVMVGVFAAAIIAFHLAARRTIDQSHRRRQVEYLARAGIEFAVAELLAGAEVDLHKTYQPLENAEVEVRVVAGEQEPDLVRISSEATLRRESRQPLVREIRWRYRLVRDDAGGIARCEFVAFDFHAASGQVDEVASEPESE